LSLFLIIKNVFYKKKPFDFINDFHFNTLKIKKMVYGIWYCKYWLLICFF